MQSLFKPYYATQMTSRTGEGITGIGCLWVGGLTAEGHNESFGVVGCSVP